MKKIVLLLTVLFIGCLYAVDNTTTEDLGNMVMSSTKELVFQLVAIVITVIIGYVGNLAKQFLQTNKYAIEYNLNNEKTERILSNAIAYAEAKSKDYVKDNINKRDIAISYIDKIDPSIIANYGEKLELMIDRKVEQTFQKKTQVNRGITISPSTGIQKAVITETSTEA